MHSSGKRGGGRISERVKRAAGAADSRDSLLFLYIKTSCPRTRYLAQMQVTTPTLSNM